MERARMAKEETIEQDTRFLAVYMEAENSCIVLLSEKEDKLGTLAIAVPTHDSLDLLPSSVLLGDRNTISARMFAENLAFRKKKIALVSIYLESADEKGAQIAFKKLIDKVAYKETQEEGVL